MTITKTCKECGRVFEAENNRRAYCQDCLENGSSQRMRQKRYSKKYIARRRREDPEYKQKMNEQATRSHRLRLEKQFRQKAIQIIKLGSDVDALTKYLIDNFQMRHK